MRFGLHSGPVTAGVLQGERSRFQVSYGGKTFAKLMKKADTYTLISTLVFAFYQLFGDTVSA